MVAGITAFFLVPVLGILAGTGLFFSKERWEDSGSEVSSEQRTLSLSGCETLTAIH
jgi:hypothetical protein